MGGYSTLQLAVPVVDPLLDELRGSLPAGAAVLDPGHISFGYPWMDPVAGRAALDEVAGVLAREEPLEVYLHGPQRFAPDAKGRTIVYLAPRPEAAIRALGRHIAKASGHPLDDFTPHCSLVRLPNGVDPEPLERRVDPHVPLRALLDRVEFHVQTGRGWITERVMALGASTP